MSHNVVECAVPVDRNGAVGTTQTPNQRYAMLAAANKAVIEINGTKVLTGECITHRVARSSVLNHMLFAVKGHVGQFMAKLPPLSRQRLPLVDVVPNQSHYSLDGVEHDQGSLCSALSLLGSTPGELVITGFNCTLVSFVELVVVSGADYVPTQPQTAWEERHMNQTASEIVRKIGHLELIPGESRLQRVIRTGNMHFMGFRPSCGSVGFFSVRHPPPTSAGASSSTGSNPPPSAAQHYFQLDEVEYDEEGLRAALKAMGTTLERSTLCNMNCTIKCFLDLVERLDDARMAEQQHQEHQTSLLRDARGHQSKTRQKALEGDGYITLSDTEEDDMQALEQYTREVRRQVDVGNGVLARAASGSGASGSQEPVTESLTKMFTTLDELIEKLGRINKQVAAVRFPPVRGVAKK